MSNKKGMKLVNSDSEWGRVVFPSLRGLDNWSRSPCHAMIERVCEQHPRKCTSFKVCLKAKTPKLSPLSINLRYLKHCIKIMIMSILDEHNYNDWSWLLKMLLSFKFSFLWCHCKVKIWSSKPLTNSVWKISAKQFLGKSGCVKYMHLTPFSNISQLYQKLIFVYSDFVGEWWLTPSTKYGLEWRRNLPQNTTGTLTSLNLK